MAASPLPRWAPTPSPTRPLRTPGTPSAGAGAASSSSSSSSSWRSCVPLLTTFSSVFGSSAVRRGGGLSGGEPPPALPDAGRHDIVGGIAPLDGVVALMGPSGCGKTTLLDALAGRLSPNMKMRGDILINGLREKLSFGTSAYVTQENVLMATLTVTEAGISGGQRKRVSICVELLASPALLFLDEPTSGLDSAASYHVMSRIAGLARRDGMTVVAAVHQPSTEMFELFHGLCLLATGRTVYFGGASDAIEFFESNGFPCPLRRNPSDHFLRMINKDFEGASPIPQRQATFLTKTYARASMLMFTSTLLTMMAIGGFPSFVEDMKIFRKERMSGHYGATEFVISNTLSSIPYLGLISIIPGAIAYYLTGLQRGIDHFIYFAAVLWACTMLVEGLMMIVAAVVPDFLLGIITGSGVQGVLMLNAGFFRLPSDLPKPVWKYPTYFISYHKYATQGLYKNELLGLVFEDIGGGGLTISGEYILKNYLQISEIVKPRMLHFLCASKV
uniref:ABC transporter domain-containing protein n=1 Tax=Oryza barthii TaxID=65489 RepID=A0A0D3GPP8_9ORYZ